MAEEQFEIFDAAGNALGMAPRSRVHREGLWHRAANIFLFRSDGRLLMQRRHETKDVGPGAWDLSVAEHLRPGESYEQGATRGLREELGVENVVLKPLGCVAESRLEIVADDIKDYELQQSFRGVFDGPVAPNPREVSEIRLLSLEELAIAFAKQPEEFTPWFRRRVAELSLL